MIRAARDVRFNSDFATLRIRLKLRFRIRNGVLPEFFRETEFFSGGTPERGLDLSRIQLRVHSESFQEVRSFSVQTPQHGKILLGKARRIPRFGA